MALSTGNIRLVFGLKLKQLRLDKQMSLSDLSRRSGLSISYINEIEKGKKYPKSDKIVALANAMGEEYDSLVSLKLSKRLEPISALLDSNIIGELPLELFGIDPATLLEMLSDAPVKISAFIGTLIEISRNYNVSTEQFYFSALRTYQEMHDNYFEDIELEAERFLSGRGIGPDRVCDEAYLADLLTTGYGYQIETIDERKYPDLAEVRSLAVIRPNRKRLLVNGQLSGVQRTFVYGREIGYDYLKLKKRLYTTDLAYAESFEHLLNNYKASYFASAIIIKRAPLAERLAAFFAQPVFRPELLLDMMEHFNTTPESFCYRVSNVLPRYFGINQLYFLRFTNFAGQDRFDLTKEMHISRKHNPHAIRDEHYCRRWVALTIFRDLNARSEAGSRREVICKSQITRYVDTSDEYFVITFAKPLSHDRHLNVSVSMGIFINEEARKQIMFLNDPAIRHREVNDTCERCPLFDCKERVAAPIVLQRRNKAERLQRAVNRVMRETDKP